MKILKLSLFLLITLIFYSVSGFHGVSAVDTDVTWTMDTSATEHFLLGEYEFGLGVKEVTIHMPDDIAYILDNGTTTANFKFYNSSDVLVKFIDLEDEFGDLLTSQAYSYQINFEVLSIPSTATYLKFTLPQTYTDTAPADAGYIDYVNDNTTVDRNTQDTVLGLFRFYWEELVGSSANYLQSDEILVPLGTEFIGLRYAFGFTGRIFEAESKMYFYDDADILLDTITLYPYEKAGDDNNVYGSYDISLVELVDNYEDIEYFTLKAAIWQYTPAILYIHNNSLLYTFDGEVNTVNFYNGTEIIYTHKSVIGGIARYPGMNPDGGAGKEFSHWITANGVEYNWTAIDNDMLVGSTVNFYAIFEDIPDAIDISVTDPTADEGSLFTGALTTMGFNDPIERTIVFGFVAVITAGFMLWKGISIIATVVVVGCELFFFMYLGLLPAFVSIIIILLLVFVGWGYRKGGAS